MLIHDGGQEARAWRLLCSDGPMTSEEVAERLGIKKASAVAISSRFKMVGGLRVVGHKRNKTGVTANVYVADHERIRIVP